MKRRRDAIRIIYEILLLSRKGVSKTQAVYGTNLNFRLMERYLSFLTAQHYLQLDATENPSLFILTNRGTILLDLLARLETEIAALRAPNPYGYNALQPQVFPGNGSRRHQPADALRQRYAAVAPRPSH